MSSSKEPLRRHVRNILSNWTSFLFSAGIAFFLSPFIVASLGDSAYGIWVLLGSLTGYMGLLSLGVRGGVTRYVARFHARGDHGTAGGIASTALAVFLVGGGIAVTAAAGLSFFIGDLFDIGPQHREMAQWVLILSGFNIAVSLIGGVFGGILVGLQRFDVVNAIDIAEAALRAAAIAVALWQGQGLVAMAVIHLAFSAMNALCMAWRTFTLYPQIKVHAFGWEKQHLGMLLSFSGYVFVLQLSFHVMRYTDALVIGTFLPVSAVTFFAIAANLVLYTRAVVSGISTTMTPRASELDALGEQEGLRRLVLRGSSVASMVAMVICLTLMIRGHSFVGLWMGAAYAQLSGDVLWVLALALMCSASNSVASSTCLGISRHKPLVPVTLAEAACNLALSIALVKPYGILGVAMGTAIPRLLISLVFWPWYAQRALGIPVRSYVSTNWLRPGVAVVPFALATYAVETLAPATYAWVLIVQSLALIPLAALGFWYTCLSSRERQVIGEHWLMPIQERVRLMSLFRGEVRPRT